MKKQISYPKIGQFRQVVRDICSSAKYVGQDEDDNPIFNESAIMPCVHFVGRVKIHGTNAGISYNHVHGYWAQSRNRVLSIESDNAGFAFFAKTVQREVTKKLVNIASELGISLYDNTITVYGEWAGKGIQKGVAISGVEKALYTFGIKITPNNEDEKAYWLTVDFHMPLKRIISIDVFQKFEIEIDFSNPDVAVDKLIKITEAVEKQCPVAFAMGSIGVGEGVVWTSHDNMHRFKVKGEKHQSSRIKKLASVNIEQIESVKKFVEYAVTNSRFNQSLENIFGIGSEIDIKKLGDIIRWVIDDIMEEEIDVMLESNLTTKMVGGEIAKSVKRKFFNLK